MSEEILGALAGPEYSGRMSLFYWSLKIFGGFQFVCRHNSKGPVKSLTGWGQSFLADKPGPLAPEVLLRVGCHENEMFGSWQLERGHFCAGFLLTALSVTFATVEAPRKACHVFQAFRI